MNVPVGAGNIFGSDRQEARSAINGSALAGVKRNCCGGFAPVAIRTHLYTVAFARHPSHLYGFKAQILGLFTIFTAFGGIFKFFIAEESLFAGCPNEEFLAVDTRYRHVSKSAAGF